MLVSMKSLSTIHQSMWVLSCKIISENEVADKSPPETLQCDSGVYAEHVNVNPSRILNQCPCFLLIIIKKKHSSSMFILNVKPTHVDFSSCIPERWMLAGPWNHQLIVIFTLSC